MAEPAERPQACEVAEVLHVGGLDPVEDPAGVGDDLCQRGAVGERCVPGLAQKVVGAVEREPRRHLGVPGRLGKKACRPDRNPTVVADGRVAERLRLVDALVEYLQERIGPPQDEGAAHLCRLSDVPGGKTPGDMA